MIKSLFAATVALLVISPASAQQSGSPALNLDWMKSNVTDNQFRSPEVASLFQIADENYEKLGYAATIWSKQWDDLGSGDSYKFEVRLDAGDDMSFLAVCGKGCTNIDMRVMGPGGGDMGLDTKDDPFPIVGVVAPKEGTYVVQVTMVACPAKTCPIGVRAYQKH